MYINGRPLPHNILIDTYGIILQRYKKKLRKANKNGKKIAKIDFFTPFQIFIYEKD